jgi:hypothetical protein
LPGVKTALNVELGMDLLRESLAESLREIGNDGAED